MSETILGQILASGFGPGAGSAALQEGTMSPSMGHYFRGAVAPTTSTTAPASPACPGTTMTSVTTISHPTPASTNKYTSGRRTVWASATTGNATTGIRSSILDVWRGNAARRGGFLLHCRFAQVTNVPATRAFIGLSSLTTAVMVSAEPSAAAASFIGIGFNAANSNTNWRAMWKDGSTYGDADIASNAARSSGNNLWDLYIGAFPNDSGIYMYLYDVYNSAVALPETFYTTNIPLNTAFLGFHFVAGPATAGSAVSLALYRYSLWSPW